MTLPCVAPLCVWVAWAATRRQARIRIPRHAVAACAVFSVAGSRAAWPHSLAYFNELASGPAAGHWYFADSQFDWGQDLWRLLAWREPHAEARPFEVELHSLLGAGDDGIPDGGRGFFGSFCPAMPTWSAPKASTPKRASS